MHGGSTAADDPKIICACLSEVDINTFVSNTDDNNTYKRKLTQQDNIKCNFPYISFTYVLLVYK